MKKKQILGVKKYLKKKKKKQLLEEKKNQKNEPNNKDKKTSNDKKRNSAFFEKGKKLFRFDIADVVGNIFGRENSGVSLEEKERRELDNLRKKEIFKEVYNKISSEVAIRLIKDFIVHFSCFCVESYDVIDIISDISNRFRITGAEKKNKIFYVYI